MQRATSRVFCVGILLLFALLAACSTGQQTDVSSSEESTPPSGEATVVVEAETQPEPELPAPTSTSAPVVTETTPAKATTEVEATETNEATASPTVAPVEPEATGTSVSSSPTVVPEASATAETVEAEPVLSADAIVVDHTSIADFERIPDEYIAAAQELRMIYIDQSVGNNINDALNCLSNASSEQAPSHCIRYEHVEPAFSVDRSEVSWNRPGGYDRSNWEFQPYSSDCEGGSWRFIVSCFIQMMEPDIDSYDVLSFQFTYLHVGEGSQIADQPGGYFWDNEGDEIVDVYDQEAFEAQYPDKVFIYWTTSLARGIGSSASEQFNEQMRQYAIENGKPLFDVADILSHDPDGNPCYDNRDGVPYDNGNNVEDFPDDGQDYLAICQHYTTETEGGHLGRVSAGKIRVAKAFWVLMARIAGWDGS